MDDALLRRLDMVVTLLGAILGAVLVIALLAWGANGFLLVGSAAFVLGIGAAALVQLSGQPTDDESADASAQDD